jgi:hypothetical protein
VVRRTYTAPDGADDFLQQFRSLEARAIRPQPLAWRAPARTAGQKARTWLLKGLVIAAIVVGGGVAVGSLVCFTFLYESCTAQLLR